MKFTTYPAFKDVHEIADVINPYRQSGKTIVTTNGCFDIIHSGHIRYLAEAASLGDILVVGVNADQTVRKLKGEDRPLQNEWDRALIISSLKMVDFSFVFHEDDPRAFLEILRPDIHVKGGDYHEDIIERPVVEKHGGKVRIVSMHQGYSTTSIVKKIRSPQTTHSNSR